MLLFSQKCVLTIVRNWTLCRDSGKNNILGTRLSVDLSASGWRNVEKCDPLRATSLFSRPEASFQVYMPHDSLLFFHSSTIGGCHKNRFFCYKWRCCNSPDGRDGQLDVFSVWRTTLSETWVVSQYSALRRWANTGFMVDLRVVPVRLFQVTSDTSSTNGRKKWLFTALWDLKRGLMITISSSLATPRAQQWKNH